MCRQEDCDESKMILASEDIRCYPRRSKECKNVDHCCATKVWGRSYYRSVKVKNPPTLRESFQHSEIFCKYYERIVKNWEI